MEYEGQVRIKLHGVPQFVWVDINAPSVALARALLQAQYGAANVITVHRRRPR